MAGKEIAIESMKSDSFSGVYQGTVPSNYIRHSSPQEVEAVVKALGTMILMPEYESDPINIGKKKFLGNTQVPILMDKARERAEKKLIELIENL